ncbi:hypothetical protein [Fuerstiella marisgermanici]|uniref:hypothetical protein n=1 Tax=Fuerstiella marisgermanici TaxID=1891926 RepID=UPI00097CBDF7|nr:hypothetical protein [Fuerstiella marisgermanici]
MDSYVLSSPDFDATTIDDSTVLFADILLIDTLGQSPVKINVEDVDGDGLDDLLVLFSKNDLVNSGALNEDTIAVGLSAETTLGEAIIGLDFVSILE